MLPPLLSEPDATDGISLLHAPVGHQNDDLTSVSITASTLGTTQNITKYAVVVRRYENDGVTLISQDSSPREFAQQPLTITNLIPGGYYTFQIDTYSGTQKSVSSAFLQMKLSSQSIASGIISQADSKGLVDTPGKAYLTLSGAAATSPASLVWKEFSAINTSSKYYSFGTSIMLDNTLTNTAQSAGLGFFVDNAGGTGYYLVIESTASAASINKKSFRVIRVQGNQFMYELPTSQTIDQGSIDGVIGGKEYQIDVKAQVLSNKINLVIKVNGFIITASDEDKTNSTVGSKGATKILPSTNKLALVCFKGNSAFDYIYGTSITDKQYQNVNYEINFYQGQFSNDFLRPQFSDLIYTTQTEFNPDFIPKGTSYDEFGTTARQILKTDFKFESRPAYPINPSTGINKLAKIIASKISNFGATIYVLNNSSSTIPLADGGANTFWVYGNTLGNSGDLEYVTNEDGYNVKEPITINTQWLQNLSDVKSIAEWIKSKIITKGRVIDLVCFGNPLIMPGNIIAIKYGYKGLLGTEKFIVTSVTHNYDNGLETNISCRTF